MAKRRSVTRSAARFIGIAALVVIGLAAFASEFVRIHWSSADGPPQIGVDLAKCTFSIRIDRRPSGNQPGSYSLTGHWFEHGWTIDGGDHYPGTRRWAPSVDTYLWNFDTTVVTLPLWLPFVAATALTALGHPLRRRQRGHCLKCSYPLHDLPPNSACPECGAKPEVPA